MPKASKDQKSSDEIAYERVKAARKVVHRLSCESGDLAVRLAAVDKELRKLCKDWPQSKSLLRVTEDGWAPIPQGPAPHPSEVAADRLRTLLMTTIEAITVGTVPTDEGEFVRQGSWPDKSREETLAILRDYAVSHEAEMLDASDLIAAGPKSTASVDNAIGEMARELYEFLKPSNASAQ
jgi:hypothetical protein